jgi:hypothetical protein
VWQPVLGLNALRLNWRHAAFFCSVSSLYGQRSKLYDAMLAFAVARRWPDVLSNSLEPGWVPTKMGGVGAPDDMDQAHVP